jgi:hypothetical protein
MIFAVITALFVAAVYSSSTPVVFGETSCISVGSKAICVSDDSDFGGLYACVELKDKTWKCEKVKASANVPPGLTDALNDATGPRANLNDRGVLEDPTTSPQLEQDVGPNEGVLGNLQGNNMTFSRANITAPTSEGQTDDGSGANQTTGVQDLKSNNPGISCGGLCL